MYIHININKLLCKARGYHLFQDLVTNTDALPVAFQIPGFMELGTP